MKNFTVKASALAIAAALPGVASAANLLDGLTTPTYASELASVGAELTAVPPIAAKIGFGVSITQDRYLRFDLTGAKWTNDPIFVANSGNDCLAPTANDMGATVVQGGANDTSVILQITATTAISASNFMCLTPDGLTLTSAAGSSIKYQLYATAADAATGGTAGRLATASGPLTSVAAGLDYTVTPNTSTANVATGYKSFVTTVAANTAIIGSVGLEATAGVLALDTVQVALDDLISANVALSVAGGDLSSAVAANGIYLGNSTCVQGVGSTKVSATTRKIATDTTVLGANPNVCYKALGNTAIAEQTFTVALDLTAANDSSAADVSAQLLGNFDRNGTVLKAPFMSSAVGQYTFIQVANVSSVDAPWSVLCYGPSGSLGNGGSGVLPGGTTGKLAYSALGCAAGTSAVELILEAEPGNVVGTVVRQSTAGGSTGMDSMTGNL